MTTLSGIKAFSGSPSFSGRLEEKSPLDKKAQKVGKKVLIDAEDSDDELSLSEMGITEFSRKTPIKALAMTIPCIDDEGRVKNIKGSTLIKIVHDSVQKKYGDFVDLACEYEREIDGAVIGPPRVDDGAIYIEEPKDWLMSLGGWKGMAPKKEVDHYFFSFGTNRRKFTGAIINGLTFPIEDHRIHLPKGFSIGKLDLTTKRTDLSYKQIVLALSYIKENFGLSDIELATLQLSGLSHELAVPEGTWEKIPEKNQNEILQFLDYLNALMFGIEPSGLNAALAISLMTLDLIVDGYLDYQNAFTANHDGGAYPYACFGDNRGTYNKREEVLAHDKSMKELRNFPYLSPVANKEAMLIKAWLELNGVIASSITYDEQIKEIKRAVDDLFVHYFSPGMKTKFLKKFASAKQAHLKTTKV